MNFRPPDRQMRMAFDFKEKFDRSGVSSLSATIEIDRSIFLESAISTAPSTWPKTTVSISPWSKKTKGPFTGCLHSCAKHEASAVYEHKAYTNVRDP
jgi:hypothetical protein